MTTDQSTEVFRLIPGYLGYRVSDRGRVQTCCYYQHRMSVTNQWRDLHPGRQSSGHFTIGLRRDGRKFTVGVHRLVLLAFVGPCPPGMEACHNNGNPGDNRLENLRWDTRVSNFADRDRHGRTARGERSGKAILTEAKVKEACDLYSRGYSMPKIARMFGVSTGAIRGVLDGYNWSHLTGIVIGQAGRRKHPPRYTGMLTDSDVDLLELVIAECPDPYCRRNAGWVLIANRGEYVEDIVSEAGVCRQIVEAAIGRFRRERTAMSLVDAKGRRRVIAEWWRVRNG